jgi:anti-sigma factor RsiW
MRVEIVSRPLPSVRRSGRGLLWLMAFAFVAIGLWFQGRPEFVAWQLARDHRMGLAERPGGRVWSSEPRVVSAWLERRGTPVPPLPDHAGSAALVGARYCSLVDRVAAHVLYEGDRTSVSLFVITGPLRAHGAWSASAHGLHMRFVRTTGRFLAIVGESEEDVRAALRAFETSSACRPSDNASRGRRHG